MVEDFYIIRSNVCAHDIIPVLWVVHIESDSGSSMQHNVQLGSRTLLRVMSCKE